MKKILSIMLAILLLASGQAFALQISSSGDRGDANCIFTAVFNDSGGTLTSGTVVIWDTGTDETTAQFGAYVTTTTSADSNLAAGVVHQSSILDQGIGAIQIYGPREALFAKVTDSGTQTAGTAVGTTTVAGQFGTGTGLGVILRDTGNGPDGELEYIFINPSNAE